MREKIQPNSVPAAGGLNKVAEYRIPSSARGYQLIGLYHAVSLARKQTLRAKLQTPHTVMST